MQVMEIRIDESTTGSYSNQTKQINITRIVPNILRIESIRLVNRTTNVPATNHTLTHSVNPATQEITISGGIRETSYNSQTEQKRLIRESVSGDQRFCYYEGGATRTTSATHWCATFLPVTTYSHQYRYNLFVEYTVNHQPSAIIHTDPGQTIREGESLRLDVSITEPDVENTVDVWFVLNGSMTDTLSSFTSDTEPFRVEREFLFRAGYMEDVETGQRLLLDESAEQTLQVFAQDNLGSLYESEVLPFWVDSRLPPEIQWDSLETVQNLLESDEIEVTGSVSDPNGDAVQAAYRLNENVWTEATLDTGQVFRLRFPISALSSGENRIDLRATDEYGLETTRSIIVEREAVVQPLANAVGRYRLNSPTRRVKEAQVRILRETGDLTVTAHISMINAGEDERIQPMTRVSSVPVGTGIVEDLYTYTHTEPVEKTVVQIGLARQNVSSAAKVRRITGTLN